MLPQHSTASNEHFTPTEVVKLAHNVLGGIDLDPASCATANNHVGAVNYLTKEEDGLRYQWKGRLFVNPPGGMRNGSSQALLFWNKLVEEYEAHRVVSALFV